MNLLHVDASPRERSLSRLVSGELVAALRAEGPVDYTHRDLAADPVPHISGAWTEICDNLMRDRIVELDRLHEGARTSAQRQAWSVLQPLLTEVVSADVIVLATPMYNYSVPSALKAWIDQITFPRMVLSPRRFVVVAARGGSYDPGTAKGEVEHQTRYLSDFVRGHYSVDPPAVLTVDLGNATVDPLLSHLQEAHQSSVEGAVTAARALARTLHATRARR